MRLEGWLSFAVVALVARAGADEPEINQQQQQQNETHAARVYVVKGRFLKGQLSVVDEIFTSLYFEKKSATALQSFGEWDAAWGTGGSMKAHEYKLMHPHQRFNHFPCTRELGTKNLLHVNLAAARKTLGSAEYDFFPHSYLLPQDTIEVQHAFARGQSLHILKPKAQARGEGIRMVSSWADVPQKDTHKYLVQEYIGNPLLIDGYKHTLRVYVAVTSFDPLRVYWLTDGFVHMSTQPYSTAADTLDDVRIHVTNPDVQGDTWYGSGGSDQYWNLTRFKQHLSTSTTLNASVVWEHMERVVVKTVIAAEEAFGQCLEEVEAPPTCCFEVWGFDLMLDDTGKVWVIEVNHTPSTNTDFPASRQIKRWMVQDLLGMQLSSAQARRDMEATVSQRLESLGWTGAQALPWDALDVLVDTELELSLQGHYRRIFPSPRSLAHPYARVVEPSYYDVLLEAWEHANGRDL